MSKTRHGLRQFLPLALSFIMVLTGCSVYTVKPGHFQATLRQKSHKHKGLALNSVNFIKKGKNHNSLDTLSFYSTEGKKRTKKFNYDSKITVVTKDNKEIRYYVKTLYIWNDQYLIGERTKVSFNGPNYFPVKLEDISRIEIKGL
jgi:hypothetical protein